MLGKSSKHILSNGGLRWFTGVESVKTHQVIYNGLLKSLHSWVGFHPLYTLNNHVFSLLMWAQNCEGNPCVFGNFFALSSAFKPSSLCFFLRFMKSSVKNRDSYCWWFKHPAFTSWYAKYPNIYRVSYLSGGAGFLPSTVGFPFSTWSFSHYFQWRTKVGVSYTLGKY